MKIYLAGGISGNLKPLWSDITKNMKIYLAGNNGKWTIIENFLKNKSEQNMKIYLAGTRPYQKVALIGITISKDMQILLTKIKLRNFLN